MNIKFITEKIIKVYRTGNKGNNMEKLYENNKIIGTYDECNLCPRACMISRECEPFGVCKMSNQLKVARAALHYWEEPCISGEKGSGAIFFSGCNLHCVYCQNTEIAHGKKGKEITIGRLSERMLELQEEGANNINLVTPTHYMPSIVSAIQSAKNQGLKIPVVYNTSGYESVDSLKRLEGIVDIYLPDFKYFDEQRAGYYSHAKDYPTVAKAAIEEMVRQQPRSIFYKEGETFSEALAHKRTVYEVEDGYLMGKGVIVRHLLLPNGLDDSKAVIRYLFETYHHQIYLSLMSQYTPLKHVQDFPELNRAVTQEEYDILVDYAIELGVECGFIQEMGVAEESFIPEFDGEGV